MAERQPLGTDTACDVRGIFRQVLPAAEWRDDLTFSQFGGDSLAFVQFLLRLSSRVPEHILNSCSVDMTLGQLERLATSGGSSPDLGTLRHGTPMNAGRLPVTGNRYSFLSRIPSKRDSWLSVSPALHVSAEYRAEIARRTTDDLLCTFDGLRMRLQFEQGRWIQEVVDDGGLFHELPPYDRWHPQAADDRLLNEIQDLASTISLAARPALVAFAPYADGDGFLIVFVVHHALCDAMSKDSLYRRAIALYRSHLAGTECADPIPARYSDYCHAYRDACGALADEGQEFWRDQPWPPPGRRRPYARSTQADSHEVARQFDASLTRTFLDASTSRYGIPFAHLALAAIGEAYRRWTGESVSNLGMVNHGRAGLTVNGDILRMVGWTSEVVPLVDASKAVDRASIRQLHEKILRLSRLGRLFDYLRFIVDQDQVRREFASMPDPFLSLNILIGSASDPGWAIPVRRESFGWDYTWRGERVYPVSGGLVLSDDRLRLSWDYDPTFVDDQSMRQFLDQCGQCLLQLAA